MNLLSEPGASKPARPQKVFTANSRPSLAWARTAARLAEHRQSEPGSLLLLIQLPRRLDSLLWSSKGDQRPGLKGISQIGRGIRTALALDGWQPRWGILVGGGARSAMLLSPIWAV